MSPRRGWGLIWDIDGTLLSNSKRPMARYVAHAVEATWGSSVDPESLNLHGRTDLQVVSAALGLDPSEVRERMPVFEAFLNDRPGLDATSFAAERRVLEGVLGCLDLPSGAVRHQTLASGAGAQRSIRKVSAKGLDHYFCWTCANFGDLAADRVSLLRTVLGQSQTAHGLAHHVVVGDTPDDITAAQCLGLPSVAIASGAFSFDELADLSPDLVLDAADPQRLLQFLLNL